MPQLRRLLAEYLLRLFLLDAALARDRTHVAAIQRPLNDSHVFSLTTQNGLEQHLLTSVLKGEKATLAMLC